MPLGDGRDICKAFGDVRRFMRYLAEIRDWLGFDSPMEAIDDVEQEIYARFGNTVDSELTVARATVDPTGVSKSLAKIGSGKCK